MGILPETLREELNVEDFEKLIAHFGLADPNKTLEKEINYHEALDEIRIERLQRAVDAVKRRPLTFDEMLNALTQCKEHALRNSLDNDRGWYRPRYKEIIQSNTLAPA